MRRKQQRRRVIHHRGYMLAEGLIGMALMTAVFAVVIAAVHSQRRISARLAVERDDLRAVRGVLLDLQRKHPTSAPVDSAVTIHPLPTTAPSGWRWVDATLHHVTLTALVPTSVKGSE